MKNKILTGGCICGEVKYKLTETPLFTQACHCKDCKILTGSSYDKQQCFRKYFNS